MNRTAKRRGDMVGYTGAPPVWRASLRRAPTGRSAGSTAGSAGLVLRCFLKDLRIQRRSGFWTVYAIICAIYLAVLFLVPARMVPDILTFILFADPCALGFYFVGGFAYLERDDGTLDALSVSPAGYREHLTGRVLSFAALALASSTLIVVLALAGRGIPVDPVRLAIGLGSGVSIGAAFFTLVGILPATRFRTITDYIIASELWLLPFIPPLLARFGIIRDWAVWQVLPSHAVISLIDFGLGRGLGQGPGRTAQGSGSEILQTMSWLFVLIAWTMAAAFAAARAWRIRIDGGEDASLRKSARRPFARRSEARAAVPEATTGSAAAAKTDALTLIGAISDQVVYKPAKRRLPRIPAILSIPAADLRIILRDRMLAIIPFVPFLAAVGLRFIFPFAVRLLRPVIDLAPYSPFLGGFFLLIGASMSGFLAGFLFLDEYEEGILESMGTTTRGALRHAAARLLAASVLAFTTGLAAFPLLGLPSPSMPVLAAAALQASLCVAPIALMILAFARNKVEGLTISKLAGFVLLAPLLPAFVADPWGLLAGIFPTWWVMAIYLGPDRGGLPILPALAGGAAVSVLWTAGFGVLAARKTGSRG